MSGTNLVGRIHVRVRGFSTQREKGARWHARRKAKIKRRRRRS